MALHAIANVVHGIGPWCRVLQHDLWIVETVFRQGLLRVYILRQADGLEIGRLVRLINRRVESLVQANLGCLWLLERLLTHHQNILKPDSFLHHHPSLNIYFFQLSSLKLVSLGASPP